MTVFKSLFFNKGIGLSRKMSGNIFYILGVGVFGYILICAIMYFKQANLLFHPTVTNPSYDRYRYIRKTHNGDKSGYWINRDANSLVLYFGGNAEQVVDNIPRYLLIPEFSVFLVNYPGYNGADGQPSERAIYADAMFWYEHFVDKGFKNIIVIGRSLGSGAASYLAWKKPISNMILITPYDSITSVAQTHYPFLPVEWILEHRFDSARRIESYKGRLLVLLASEDRVIPKKHSIELLEKAHLADVQVLEIESSQHNNLQQSQRYWDAIKNFLSEST